MKTLTEFKHFPNEIVLEIIAWSDVRVNAMLRATSKFYYNTFSKEPILKYSAYKRSTWLKCNPGYSRRGLYKFNKYHLEMNDVNEMSITFMLNNHHNDALNRVLRPNILNLLSDLLKLRILNVFITTKKTRFMAVIKMLLTHDVKPNTRTVKMSQYAKNIEIIELVKSKYQEHSSSNAITARTSINIYLNEKYGNNHMVSIYDAWDNSLDYERDPKIYKMFIDTEVITLNVNDFRKAGRMKNTNVLKLFLLYAIPNIRRYSDTINFTPEAIELLIEYGCDPRIFQSI